MPAFPHPDPPLAAPYGIHGSLKRILTVRLTDPKPTVVSVDERPTQLDQYPCVNIKSGGTSGINYSFENGKTKTYVVEFELFGRSLSEVERMGIAIEAILEANGPEESTSAVRQIASLNDTAPDGVQIEDLGGERYGSDRTWSSEDERTYRGTLRYAVTVARSFG